MPNPIVTHGLAFSIAMPDLPISCVLLALYSLRLRLPAFIALQPSLASRFAPYTLPLLGPSSCTANPCTTFICANIPTFHAPTPQLCHLFVVHLLFLQLLIPPDIPNVVGAICPCLQFSGLPRLALRFPPCPCHYTPGRHLLPCLPGLGLPCW